MAYLETFRMMSWEKVTRRIHIGVSVWVIGRAMHHDVNAQGDGVLIDGSRERVVNDTDGAVLARHGGDRGQINAAQQGIGRGFDVNEARGQPDGAAANLWGCLPKLCRFRKLQVRR